MALNVKAAMMICMAFIGGACWIIQQIEAPRVELVSPLMARPARTAASEAMSPTPRVLGEVAHRRTLAQRFARPSAVDQSMQASAQPRATLALHQPAISSDHRTPSALLPAKLRGPAGWEDEPADTALADAGTGIMTEPAPPKSESDGPATADATIPATSTRYTVARGDTLWTIIHRTYGTSNDRLIRLVIDANPHLRSRKNRILVGEELVLPPQREITLALTDDTRGTAQVRLASSTATAEPEQFRWYTIRRNDTLASIARRFLNDHRRWHEIVEVNEKIDPHKIFPGMKIKLPVVGVVMAG